MPGCQVDDAVPVAATGGCGDRVAHPAGFDQFGQLLRRRPARIEAAEDGDLTVDRRFIAALPTGPQAALVHGGSLGGEQVGGRCPVRVHLLQAADLFIHLVVVEAGGISAQQGRIDGLAVDSVGGGVGALHRQIDGDARPHRAVLTILLSVGGGGQSRQEKGDKGGGGEARGNPHDQYLSENAIFESRMRVAE